MTGRVGKVLAWSLLAIGGVIGCGEKSDRPAVVAYVSADRAVAIPVLEAFTRETGIDVKPLFDTEATKTTGLANRIRRERDRPRADVFWSSEPFAVEQLASEGLLAPASHPLLQSHPDQWRRSDDRWFAFAGRARVIAFDPERIAVEDRPKYWSDLVDPRWKDRIAMADPRFGTTRGHLGALAVVGSLGPAGIEYPDWIAGLARNRVRLLPGGNAATVDAVVRGEVLLGLTDSDDVRALRRRGVEIGAIVPRHQAEGVPGGGTMLVPNAAGVVDGSSQPELAARLVAFLASATVEKMLQESPSGNQPIAHPGIVGDRDDSSGLIHASDPLVVSIPEVAAGMDRAVDSAMDRFQEDRDP